MRRAHVSAALPQKASKAKSLPKSEMVMLPKHIGEKTGRGTPRPTAAAAKLAQPARPGVPVEHGPKATAVKLAPLARPGAPVEGPPGSNDAATKLELPARIGPPLGVPCFLAEWYH